MIRVLMVGMSTDRGGVETFISNLCAKLPEKYQIVYCLPHMEIDGVVWNCPPNRHNYIRYRKFWANFFKRNHFDVLYYNTCDIVSIDMLRFAKKAGIPVRIIHSHNTDNQVRMTLFHQLTERLNRKYLHRYATHLFACSRAAGKWMFGDRGFTVIQNGISLKKYAFSEDARAQCRMELGGEVKRIVGCVGRLDPQKNPLFAAEIARRLCSAAPDVQVVFIGDGELRTQVAEQIEKDHLSERVRLLGARDDVNRWYSALDCLMMPSLFEGLPFVLVEAQAAGLPCVVSSTVSRDANIAGLVEYVPLQEPAESWAQTILRACQKPRCDAAQKLVDAGYSIEDTAREVTAIIEAAVGEGK